MTTTPNMTAHRVAEASKRVGYTIGAAVNAFMLYLVNNLQRWDILPWLTHDFSRVLPWINVSLVAGLLANVYYIIDHSKPVRAIGEIMTTLIGLVVTVRVLSVFPFDFSDYDFNWGFVFRALLVVAIIGSLIGIIVNAVKLAKAASEPE